MGHCEMGLAVAGLTQTEINERTRKLAKSDWSDFPPAEALAFRTAYRLTRTPAAFSNEDARELVATFGDNRALDLIWHASWCNYMTRVADAFQLPLERVNVFASPR
jgi:hypothetical protein